MTLRINRFLPVFFCLAVASFSWSSFFNNLPRVVALLAALVIVLGIRARSKQSHNLILIFTVLAWIGYASISALNSIDPLGSVFKIAEVVLLLIIIFIGIGAASLGSHSIENFILLSFAIMAFAVLIYAAVYKGTLVELSSSVPAINANTVGTISGTALLLFLSQKRLLLSLLAIFFLYWSYSASAIISVMIAISVFLYATKVHARFGFLSRKFLFCTFCLLLIYFSFYAFDLIFVQRQFLLSGRVVLWERAIDNLGHLVSTFYGVGLGNVDLYLEQTIGRKVTVHNAYLELYLALGEFALVAFLFYVISLVLVLWINVSKLDSYCLPILIFLVIKAFTTSNLVYISFDLVVFLMISLNSFNRLSLRDH